MYTEAVWALGPKFVTLASTNVAVNRKALSLRETSSRPLKGLAHASTISLLPTPNTSSPPPHAPQCRFNRCITHAPLSLSYCSPLLFNHPLNFLSFLPTSSTFSSSFLPSSRCIPPHLVTLSSPYFHGNASVSHSLSSPRFTLSLSSSKCHISHVLTLSGFP